MVSLRDFGTSYCEEEDGSAISNLFPRVSIFHYISLAPGKGKMRDPDFIDNSGSAFFRVSSDEVVKFQHQTEKMTCQDFLL